MVSLLQNRLTLCILTLAISLLAVDKGFAATSPGVEAWWADEKLHMVKEGTILPPGLKFRQNVTLRALLLRWQFYSLLEHIEDGEMKVETFNAPSFVPDGLAGDLVSLGRSLSLFDVEVISYDEKKNVLHVSGPRPDFKGTGAKSGEFWIDVEQGVVRRAELVYNWGTMSVEQEYKTIGDHLVLSKQSARMRRFGGATLEIRYSDYTFP